MELRSAWLYEESATEACAHYAGKARCGRWVQGRREGRPTTLQILAGGLWYVAFLLYGHAELKWLSCACLLAMPNMPCILPFPEPCG
jgi:hypothetical protein